MRRDLSEYLNQVVDEHKVDVVILVESGIQTAKLLEGLNKNKSRFRLPFSVCQKVTIVAGYASRFIKAVSEDVRTTIREFDLPGRDSFLLVATHMPSKMHTNEDSQLANFFNLSLRIKEAEDRVGHNRTVLVGDLNANPFEKSLVSASALNAVPTKGIALRENRTVQGMQKSFFYNPMWKFFGDLTLGPPGTFYYGLTEDVGHFWNVFDQVLIRPSLISSFDHAKLQVLTEYQNGSFLLNGVPNKAHISDHLPLIFTLH